jgi:hypothetical protein
LPLPCSIFVSTPWQVHLKHLDGRIEEVKWNNTLYFILCPLVHKHKVSFKFQILTSTGSLFLSTGKWFSWRYCSILLQVICSLTLSQESRVYFCFNLLFVPSFYVALICQNLSLFYSCFDYTNGLAVSPSLLDCLVILHAFYFTWDDRVIYLFILILISSPSVILC